MPRSSAGRARVVLAVYCLGLLFFLLNPAGEVPSNSIGWFADVAERLGFPDRLLIGSRFELIANVLILIPASALAAIVWARTNWRDWTAYGFAFSASIELFQGLFLAGRSATFVDVVANTLGALVGAALVGAWRWLADR